MSWKEFGKRFLKNNKEESSLERQETENQEKENDFEEPVKSEDDFNPKDSDIKNKNKRVVFILSIALIFFGLFIYVASKNRQQPVPPPQNKEEIVDFTGISEDELEESSSIYELKKEVEELMSLVNKKESSENVQDFIPPSNSQTVKAKKQERPYVLANENKPIPDLVSQKNNQVNNSPSSYPFNGNEALVFPDQPINEEPPKKYIVQVVDNPFQGKAFASLYTDVPIYDSPQKIKPVAKSSKSSTIPENPDVKPALKEKKTESQKESIKKEKEKEKSVSTKFTIPSGSFFKVILLNGVDAPTGMKGKGSPYPVVARVLTNSVLPNRFFADMKGCFVLGEAVGELYNERAIIRFTKISCVTKKGKVIQKDMLGTIAGEDGKIGLAGRVVSKSGTILARTILAKFVESAGNIFALQSQIISTSGVGTVTTIKPEEAGKAAAYSGLAGAARTLSEYYLELADQIFPIVEINAGRQGDVILLKPLVIDINSDFQDNGAFIQRSGILASESPEEKVFKVEEK